MLISIGELLVDDVGVPVRGDGRVPSNKLGKWCSSSKMDVLCSKLDSGPEQVNKPP